MTSTPSQEKIRGRLALVVGPSGAGKDTLIERARTAFKHDRDIVFARRVITRPPAGEDHDTLDETAFVQAREKGAFLLSWGAHGLHYGLPAALLEDLRQGRTVIANVSRSVIAEAESLNVDVAIFNVTAPSPILARRIAARGRETVAEIEQRLRREQSITVTRAKLVHIDNSGDLEAAADAFIAAIRACHQA